MRCALFIIFINTFIGITTLSAARAGEPIDYVFDLDWTLFYVLPKDSPVRDQHTYFFGDEGYRVADYAVEVLTDIANWPDARISFFSGGLPERNEALLKALQIPGHGTAWDLAYKVLNKDDLTRVSNDESLKFSKRFKKDLQKISPNLNRVALADDTPTFVLPGQDANQLWVPTYSFYSRFENVPAEKAQYDPADEAAWLSERRKMLQIWEAFRKMHQHRETENPLQYLPKDLPDAASPCPVWLRSIHLR